MNTTKTNKDEGRVEKMKCIRQTSYKGFGKSAYILSIM